MIKVVRKFLIISLIGFLVLISYTVWDNYRVKVAEQNIVIQDLPKELEGFSILQITDLHEESFGKDQKRLLKLINSIDYDAIIFTGDMLDNRGSTNYQQFYSVLEGIQNNENILAVPGNADPSSYQIDMTIEKADFVKGMEDRGVQFLESINTLEHNGERIHFVNFELSIIKNPEKIGRVNGSFQSIHASNEMYQEYQTKLWEEMVNKDVFNSSDVVIALNHYPVPDIRIEYITEDPNTVWNEYDLIVAGHYHGGQIRLPYFGALFVPEPWYEPNSFFPPKDRVKGLWEYDGTKQYVSAGLGTSDVLPFLKFRLFNPSEINLLTLTKE